MKFIIFIYVQAVRLLMHPDNAPTAMESLAHMVDEVWYHAGDTSTDVIALLALDKIDSSDVKVVVIVCLFCRNQLCFKVI